MFLDMLPSSWKLDLVTLKPMRDRWIYVVSFVAPPPPECKDCLSIPFILVVTMDGKALPAEISPARGNISRIVYASFTRAGKRSAHAIRIRFSGH